MSNYKAGETFVLDTSRRTSDMRLILPLYFSDMMYVKLVEMGMVNGNETGEWIIEVKDGIDKTFHPFLKTMNERLLSSYYSRYNDEPIDPVEVQPSRLGRVIED